MKHGEAQQQHGQRGLQQAAGVERAVLVRAGRAGAAHLRRTDDHREEEEAPKGDQHARGSNPGRTVHSWLQRAAISRAAAPARILSIWVLDWADERAREEGVTKARPAAPIRPAATKGSMGSADGGMAPAANCRSA